MMAAMRTLTGGELPGGIVTQKDDTDCFSASISMLTGIDLDLLPILPPALYHVSQVSPFQHKWAWGDHPHFDAKDGTFICLDESTLPWVDLLLDNGFRMTISLTQPDIPAIAMIRATRWMQGHATVQFPDGQFVNTNTGTIEPRAMEEGIDYKVFAWFVVTPL